MDGTFFFSFIHVVGWTSRAGVAYWGVMIHFLDKDTLQFNNIALALQEKAEQNAEGLVSAKFCSYGLGSCN
jgi:hypothetical protein